MNQITNMNSNFTIGNKYRVIGVSDINSDIPSNQHNNKVDHLCANTFMWELLNIDLTFKEQIEQGEYTYNIFETNYLKNQDNESYYINDQREVSFVKINNNNQDYTIFSFKPIFEEIQN